VCAELRKSGEVGGWGLFKPSAMYIDNMMIPSLIHMQQNLTKEGLSSKSFQRNTLS
jgi:hypothetical protein